MIEHLSRIDVARTSIALAALIFMAAPHAQTTPVSESSDPEKQAQALPAVEVVGRRTSDQYYAEDAEGTKTDLPLNEVPQAVRVMSRQTLDDLGATRIDDVLDYAGGVSRQNNFGGLWDKIAIRGLAGDINNGMPLLLNGFSANRGFNAPRDAANIERIEFLKGPVASLYGMSEPGGTVNIVTKRPLWTPAHSLEAYAGSFDTYRTALDSTGPLGENVAYRLNLAIEDRGSFRDFISTKRQFIAPALTWRLSRDTTVNYMGEVLHHETPLDRGVVAINNRLGLIPRTRFLGEPGDGRVSVNNQTHQVFVDHRINDEWAAHAGISYKQGGLRGFSTEARPPSFFNQDTGSLVRQRRFRDYSTDDLTLKAEVNRRFLSSGVGHELLLGMEASRYDFDDLMLRSANFPINVFTPLYTAANALPTSNPFTSRFEKQRNAAIYLQDTLSLGERWRVMAGARLDHYDQSILNRRNGQVSEQSPSAASPRAGVSYLIDHQWTLFANAGQSFRANNGLDFEGRAFAPETGLALEVGAKWQNTDATLGATIALFDIRKKNVLTPDPRNTNNTDFSVAVGELQSRGLDADISGKLSPHWRVNASLSLIDASVVRDNTLEIGGRLLNIPKVNGSLLLLHESLVRDGERLGIGGGLTYSSARLGQDRTQVEAQAGTPAFELPAYTVAKMVAYWVVNPRLRFSLDVDNLFNTTYYLSSYQRTWVTPGAPRSIMLGLQKKF